MAALTREQNINMVEQSYFSNVGQKELDAVLDYFGEDAVSTVQSTFTFFVGPSSGIRNFYESITAGFMKIWHGDFERTADVRTQSISTQFNLRRTDLHDAEEAMIHCNAFRSKNTKFKNIFVYSSAGNPLVPQD
jgi:hypothetical protein